MILVVVVVTPWVVLGVVPALVVASFVMTALVEASFVAMLRAGVDILSDVESIVTPAIAVDGRESEKAGNKVVYTFGYAPLHKCGEALIRSMTNGTNCT